MRALSFGPDSLTMMSVNGMVIAIASVATSHLLRFSWVFTPASSLHFFVNVSIPSDATTRYDAASMVIRTIEPYDSEKSAFLLRLLLIPL